MLVFSPGTGYFEKDENIKKNILPDKSYKLDYIIKTKGASWVDRIKNGVHDEEQEPAQLEIHLLL